ncbi:DUF4157 domain-containing protein [Streptomyces sp. NPDC096176]|uniref:eCIS core domain-containing protein n=1 Tax=Streptomyces sp. NPDC096176 TaxID=3366079 RepID=UPI003814BBBB
MQRSGRRTEGTEAEQVVRGGAATRRGTSSVGAAVPPPLTADVLRAAQRGAGNAAVTGMIARRARTAPAPEQLDTGVPEVLNSGGKPLAAPVRQDMESRFGADFSDVRIHNDSAARASAAEIGARAYTSGSHVVIGDGGNDQHTLAHELTHVIQQRQGPVSGTDHGNGLRVSDPSDRFEREAEVNATRVLSRSPVQGPTEEHSAHASGPGAAEPSVQRRPRPKPAEEEGDHTHVDPDYPGLRLVLDQAKTNEYYEKIYQLADSEERVLFDEDGSFGYIKVDEDLKTYYALVAQEIGPDVAQADLSGHFTPQRDTSYHVRANGRTFHEARIDKLQDFETQGVSPGQLVEVSVALLQQADGRANTVAGKLDPDRLDNAVTGMGNSAALEPIAIQVSSNGISISDGNHRLGAAAKLGHAYAPCRLV